TLNLTGAAAVNQNTLTVNNTSSVVTENTTNALSGTANLAISNGSVTLSQANDFNGSTTVSGGTLQLGNGNAIANSNLTLSGGTLQLRNDSATSFADASTTIGATTTIDVNRNASGTGVQLSLGPATITGAFTLNITGGNSYVLGLG